MFLFECVKSGEILRSSLERLPSWTRLKSFHRESRLRIPFYLQDAIFLISQFRLRLIRQKRRRAFIQRGPYGTLHEEVGYGAGRTVDSFCIRVRSKNSPQHALVRRVYCFQNKKLPYEFCRNFVRISVEFIDLC